MGNPQRHGAIDIPSRGERARFITHTLSDTADALYTDQYLTINRLVSPLGQILDCHETSEKTTLA